MKAFLLTRTGLAAYLFILWGFAACSGPPEPKRTESARRLNVVVITLDTFRADMLGTYGNPAGLSPEIDAFAAEATTFENAITTIGTTFPSHSSLFTGLYPKHHGVRWNGDTLDDQYSTLAEILTEKGYETAGFVSMDSMLGRGGLSQGFSVRSDELEVRTDQRIRSGADVNKLALSWLDSRSERPFFLWLHYYDTHSPYELTSLSEAKLDAAGYEGPLSKGASVETLRALGTDIPWSSAERDALRALYEGGVPEVDRLVGEVIRALRDRNLIESTIVILTADHGEALGEHDAVGHGFLLWQPVLHIPLIVRLPKIPTPRRIETRVSLIDILPTLLDLLGIDAPLSRSDGRSLAGALTGKPLSSRRYFAEVRAVGNHRSRTEADADQYAIFHENLKGIWNATEFQLLDLESDPQEHRLHELRVGEEEQKELEDLVVKYRESTVDINPRELTDEAVEELRSLGYLQ